MNIAELARLGDVIRAYQSDGLELPIVVREPSAAPSSDATFGHGSAGMMDMYRPGPVNACDVGDVGCGATESQLCDPHPILSQRSGASYNWANHREMGRKASSLRLYLWQRACRRDAFSMPKLIENQVVDN